MPLQLTIERPDERQRQRREENRGEYEDRDCDCLRLAALRNVRVLVQVALAAGDHTAVEAVAAVTWKKT